MGNGQHIGKWRPERQKAWRQPHPPLNNPWHSKLPDPLPPTLPPPSLCCELIPSLLRCRKKTTLKQSPPTSCLSSMRTRRLESTHREWELALELPSSSPCSGRRGRQRTCIKPTLRECKPKEAVIALRPHCQSSSGKSKAAAAAAKGWEVLHTMDSCPSPCCRRSCQSAALVNPSALVDPAAYTSASPIKSG